MKILIFEDNQANSDLLKEYLPGEDITTVNNTKDALRLINEKFDTCFVDIVINGDREAGVDFAKTYSILHPEAKIVAVTGYRELIPSIEKYVMKVIEKPCSLSQIQGLMSETRIIKPSTPDTDKFIHDILLLQIKEARHDEAIEHLKKSAERTSKVIDRLPGLVITLVGVGVTIAGIITGFLWKQIQLLGNIVKLIMEKM